MIVELTPLPFLQDISLCVELSNRGNKTVLSYKFTGNYKKLDFRESENNNLWLGTCFELFIQDNNRAYRELNFTASGKISHYYLQDYREIERTPKPPKFTTNSDNNSFTFIFDNLEIVGKKINITAITLLNNERVFWAKKHINKKADFHNRESFFFFE